MEMFVVTFQSVWINMTENYNKAWIISFSSLKMIPGQVCSPLLHTLSLLSSVFSPLDPFGGDPFKESDPFKGASSEDLFKRTDKSEPFGSSDPFGRKPTPPAKVLSPSAFYN